MEMNKIVYHFEWIEINGKSLEKKNRRLLKPLEENIKAEVYKFYKIKPTLIEDTN
jgi:hypothetical protein